MKITQFRKNGDTTALSVMDLEKLVNKVKTEIKSRPVSTFREELRYMLPDDRCMFADKLPEIIPAAEFRKVNGQKQMKAYNGIIELTVGPLSMEVESRRVTVRGQEVELTKKEFDLLRHLLENKGRVLTREALLDSVWGFDFVGETNSVDVYIRFLRSKIDEAFGIKLIHTVRGVGYVIKEE